APDMLPTGRGALHTQHLHRRRARRSGPTPTCAEEGPGIRLKLAIVRQRFNPFGGAERFIARALPALERTGVDVTLICRNGAGWDARQLLRIDPFYIGKVWRDW